MEFSTATRWLPQRIPTLLGATLWLVLASLAAPGPTAAGQGWWRSSPRNPGFDRNTAIQVTGTASQIDIGTRRGPATLRLAAAGENFTVVLGPGWYLTEIAADIRHGDPLVIEGSKMMDARGNLHLVAARVTNRRTGAVLELRDESGHPVWMGRAPAEGGRR